MNTNYFILDNEHKRSIAGILTSMQVTHYERDEPYLQSYLKSITSRDNKYKRVIISPLRYAGGKSKAIGQILHHLPKLKHKRIVSPFMGGGSFEMCAALHLGIEVVGYDIFGMLTNFWNVFLTRKEELVNSMETFAVTKDEFTRNRHILLHHWNKIKPETLHYDTKKVVELTQDEQTMLDNNAMMQAVYYYYNMSLSYGPMFLGWPSSVEINPDKFKRKLAKLRNMDLSNVRMRVECKHFREAIQGHPDDFLFLDPPYYLGNDSTMFKGMYPNCNFAIHHNDFEHELLCELLKSHKGGFLLTYNDCDTIRAMYKDFQHVFPEWQYSYGQGETRIGKNRDNSQTNHVKESKEIFIICPPLL